MCAAIHTKAFKDHMTLKRACMLVGILSFEEISSDDVESVTQPTHDASTGLEQHYKTRNAPVPTFPYTETPILPPELYVQGMSGKEGLQEIPNIDPFVVVMQGTSSLSATYIEFPRSINALTEHQVLVTAALLHIVHGGWDVTHTCENFETSYTGRRNRYERI